MAELPQDIVLRILIMIGAAALFLTAGRFAIRHQHKQLWADDIWLGLALLFLLPCLITYVSNLHNVYTLERHYLQFEEAPENVDIADFVRRQIVVTVFFWLTLYCVKFSFLTLYYKVFSVSTPFLRAWLAIVVLTTVSFFISVLSPLWWCGSPKRLSRTDMEKCYWSPALDTLFKIWCTINVTTDLAILMLPIYMLRSLQMSRLHKRGLVAIFCLVVIDVGLDIARTTYAVYGSAVGVDALLDILEVTIAVIVGALPPYASLLTAAKRESKPAKANPPVKRDNSFTTPHCRSPDLYHSYLKSSDYSNDEIDNYAVERGLMNRQDCDNSPISDNGSDEYRSDWETTPMSSPTSIPEKALSIC